MGTNYYLEFDVCPTCGRSADRLHIGKSSGGWCFGLHVIPEEEINSLEDWKQKWNTPKSIIKDEYGEAVSPEKMLEIITERNWGREGILPSQWYQENHAEPGPNGLARHRIGPYCVGHGEGTWDLIPGEFS